MKMPCKRNNQQPKCCHTQRAQVLVRHNSKSQPPSSLLFFTPSLCLWSWGESSVYLAVFSDPCGLLPGNFALVWVSVYLCWIFCGWGYSCLSGAGVGNTGDDFGPFHSLLWSEVPVLWPFLFWTQAFSGLWPLSAPHLPYRNPWEHLNLPNMEHKLKGTCSASREALYCPNTCGSIY